ncbi:MAG: alanine dehydrogenase, partial [Pseudomonadota bacterium]
TLCAELGNSDLIVGAVMLPGDKAPYLITRDMLKLMKKGSVIVDVSIDQGGCVETSRPTTHTHPTFEVDGIIHYCVANMPGCVPLTSTYSITKQTLPYAMEIADKGWISALRSNQALARGLNVAWGRVIYRAVADVFKFSHLPVDEAFRLEEHA